MQEASRFGQYRKRRGVTWRRLFTWLLILATLSACKDPPADRQRMPAFNGKFACQSTAHLRVDLFGAMEGRIDWQQGALDCAGMKRPNGQGARLRFSGNLPEADGSDNGRQRTVAFILSLADLREGKVAEELLTKVTLIEENAGRFFSTGEAEVCWSDVTEQKPLQDTTGKVLAGRYSISGITYCVAPIAGMNGAAGVTLTDLKFRGQLDWLQ